MARPKKALSEQLRTISTMRIIAAIHHLPPSGYALEKHFEPENFRVSNSSGRVYRSGKWDRYIKKGVTPKGKSILTIEQKSPYAYTHYTSPFWAAISVAERSDYEWQDFYLQLDKRVTPLVLKFLTNRRVMDGRVKTESMPLVKLVRIGNDHAIAALIGLLRQFKREPLAYDHIETQLYNVLFNFLSHFFTFDMVIQIYKYLFENLFNCPVTRFRESPWPNNAEVVAKMISIEHKNLLLAEDLGMVVTYEQGREFFFWKMMGDRFEIVKEMTYALYEKNWKLTDHPRGLKWLICQLNKTRPRDRQLTTEFI